MKRLAISVAVGSGSFACSIVAAVLMVEVVYGLYDLFDTFHAAATGRRLLAWAGFLFVVGPSAAILLGAPFLASRWWRTSTVFGVVVACILAGLAADRFLLEISRLNCGQLDHAFPYDIGCD